MSDLCYDSYAELYGDMRNLFLTKAPIVKSRICDTKEFIACKFTLKNPRARLGYNKDRGFNLPFALFEFLCDVTGTNDAGLTRAINPKAADYSDDGNVFYGAYGPRVSVNLSNLINKLKNDEFNRQAVITVYNSKDMYVNTKDIPCTISLQFLIRNNKLEMIVSMRSNDFFWGLQYDLFRFTMLQELVANEIGIDVGMYSHLAGSLHVYQYHWEMLEKVDKMENIIMPNYDIRIKDCFNDIRKLHALVCNADVAIDNDITKIIATRFFKNYDMPVPDWSRKFIKK